LRKLHQEEDVKNDRGEDQQTPMLI